MWTKGLRVHRKTAAVVLAVLALGWADLQSAVGQGKRIRPDELRAEDVRKAIEGGRQFLLNRRDRTVGGWPDPVSGFAGCGNALVTLGLLNAGVPANSVEIQSALRQLSVTPAGEEQKTYVVALRVMAIVAAGEHGKPFRKRLEDDVRWLIQAQTPLGNFGGPRGTGGGWGYGITGGSDFSNSQYALLALHEAASIGIEIPEQVWLASYQHWKSLETKRGGFSYAPNQGNQNGAMACAGIGSLIIIRDNLARAKDHLQDGRVVACADPPRDPMLDRAEAWLVSNFRVDTNPVPGGGRGALYYYLYGLERAGRLTGQRFFGDHDWYREGASELIFRQSLNDSWISSGDPHGESSPEVATTFALLFLSKGLRPVLFGRYDLPALGLGQHHQAGIHYLTRQIEQRWSMPLNWQSVNAESADVNDLRESPVLFLSGRELLDLSAAQKEALKRYVESGKFLFVEACQGDGCGDTVPFDRSFRDLMAELFPESRLEPLAPDHPVWNADAPIKPDPGWPLLGLQACCRTSVVYCPRNLSCYWQLDRPALLRDCPADVRRQVEYCRQIGINVAAYATGRVLDEKLNVERLGESVVTSLRGRALVFPKLRLGGGDDEAASAWRNMLQATADSTGLQIEVEKKSVDPDFEQMSDHTLLFAHGRQKFSLKDAPREAIRQYILNGGFLLVDSVCSSRDFSDSFRREMKLVFPETPLEPIPASHPVWNDPRFGHPLATVSIQRPDAGSPQGFRIERTPPLLEGIEIEGRLAVVFSPFDLSCAMENSVSSQCEGYLREDAAKIATNIILYRMRAD